MAKKINLHLFEGEGGADGGGESGVAESANPTPRTGAAERKAAVAAAKRARAFKTESTAAEPKAEKKEESETVSEASPPTDVTESREQTESTVPEKKSFRDLINGEYKEEYQAEINKALQRRFKQADETEKKYTEVAPLLEMLSAKYGITSGKADDIINALKADEEMWESAAEKSDMTVSQYKANLELQMRASKDAAEIAKYKAAQQEQQTIARLRVEAEQVKKQFPDFDLNAESENEGFSRLVRAGVPMEHAYKIVHYNELVAAEVGKAVAAKEEKIKTSIASMQNRPDEFTTGSNGIQKAVGSPFGNMTAEERRAAVKRARLGR